MFPATHYVAGNERMARAMSKIEHELQVRLAEFEQDGKLLEAQRLRMRTQYDLEMIGEVGYCNGIENYSRHLDGRQAGQPPYTLLDYFPDDYLIVLDESHVTIPQLHGQHEGDRSRKEVLVEHGFDIADHYIATHASNGDVTITADIPLAAELVDKGVHVISPRGEIYDKENIRERLSVRDFMDALRSTGVETGGPRAYGNKEKQAFASALDKTLTRALQRSRRTKPDTVDP